MKKKIAIITLNGYDNFGNRLQNFAVEHTIKILGFEPFTLRVNPGRIYSYIPKLSINERLKLLKTRHFSYIYLQIKTKLRKIFLSKRDSLIKQRREIIFKDFTKKFLNESSTIYKNKDFSENIVNKFDYFITGSDQVWNPTYAIDSSIYFLTYAPSKKRIAFAPSFGISYMPENKREQFRDWLNGMNSLSIREEAGAKIIKELTGRTAQVLLDPTAILNKKEWLEISKASENKPKKDFLLTYFLGDISLQNQLIIKKIAKKYSLEIVYLANIQKNKHYLIGPSEFIDYINSAKLFITDSFHGVIFSTIMETPFIVHKRVKPEGRCMYSRIETLLRIFNYEERATHLIDYDDLDNIFNQSFNHTSTVFKKEKEKTLRYLRKSFGIINEN